MRLFDDPPIPPDRQEELTYLLDRARFCFVGAYAVRTEWSDEVARPIKDVHLRYSYIDSEHQPYVEFADGYEVSAYRVILKLPDGASSAMKVDYQRRADPAAQRTYANLKRSV
jgi:hypothetical protein